MSLATWLTPAWDALARAIRENRVHHALLFAGPAGVGKRALADAFAEAALCDARAGDGRACGNCRACKLLAAGTHPDLARLSLEARDDGKLRTELHVDQIRALSRRLGQSSQFGGYQVAVIDPADAMNANAANAMLKTLEEPSANTVLVLVCDHPERLPATIRSRCQKFLVREPPRGEALEWLRRQGVDERRAVATLEASLGNPGRALEFAQDDSLELLGQCARDLDALMAGSVRAADVADRWHADRPDRRLWAAAVWMRDRARQAALGRRPRGLTDAAKIPKLGRWFDHANRARQLLDTPLRAEFVLLSFLAAWPETLERRGRGFGRS
jgi:DNA polymerase-3 subunit delta'